MQFKTSANYALRKSCRGSMEAGKITLNPGLGAGETGRALRSSLEKSDYLKNLLYRRGSQGPLESSLEFSRNEATKMAGGSQQAMQHSLNPRAHSYAREVDFIRPKRAAKMMLQQSFDYDSQRYGSVDNASYAQYMNAKLGQTEGKEKRGQSSTGKDSAGGQWTAGTTRAQTSTGSYYHHRRGKACKSGLTHRSIGSALAVRASARAPFGTVLESVPSRLEGEHCTPFTRATGKVPAFHSLR